MALEKLTKCALLLVVGLAVAHPSTAQKYEVLYPVQDHPTDGAQGQSTLSRPAGNTRDVCTVVASIDIERAIADSKEGERKMARIHTKVPEEIQRERGAIAEAILRKMAPVMMKVAADNGIGIIVDTAVPSPNDPIFWTRQKGGNVLRRQVDITQPVVDAFDDRSVHVPPLTCDQRVLVLDIEKAVFNTDEVKRELETFGNNIAPEQRKTILQRILKKITPVIAKVAQNRGADIVIDASRKWPLGAVIYFADQVDIADPVVSAYNAR